MHMFILDALLAIAAVCAWVLMWFIPFREQICQWFDRHRPF